MSAPFVEEELFGPQEATVETDLMGEELSPFAEAQPAEPEIATEALLDLSRGYFNEADSHRRSGTEPRDDTWDANWDAYWSRYDWSDKAEWQAREMLPEVQNFVERFAASLRQALLQNPDWFEIDDPTGRNEMIAEQAEKLVRFFLDRASTNVTGQPVGFSHVFAQMVKSGCMMKCDIAVTWDAADQRVRIDPVDSREVYHDPSLRGLYRIRQHEVDWHQLLAMAANAPDLYNAEALDRLAQVTTSSEDSERREDRRRSSGSGEEIQSTRRRTIVIQEFLGKILDENGNPLFGGQTMLWVVANDQEVIRGPEPNPFWHANDWILSAPLVTVPFSAYGRSYVEGFRQLWSTFVELTNLILDATFTNSMNAFMAWPDALEDPNQLNDGVHPNKTFLASDETAPGTEFIRAVQLGRLPTEAVTVWTALKNELREGASQSEIALGQLADKSEVTATEVAASSQGTRGLVFSIARDIDDQILSPMIEMVWSTALQHLDPSDPTLVAELGTDLAQALAIRRQEYRALRFRFKAKAITGAIERAQRVRNLLGALNVIGSNELLLREYVTKFSVGKTLDMILRDMGVDTEQLVPDQQELLMRQLQAALGQAGGTAPRPNGSAQGGLASLSPLPVSPDEGGRGSDGL